MMNKSIVWHLVAFVVIFNGAKLFLSSSHLDYREFAADVGAQFRDAVVSVKALALGNEKKHILHAS
jgi:hypothetical protein